MRLIDADDLYKRLPENNVYVSVDGVKSLIVMQPTIDVFPKDQIKEYVKKERIKEILDRICYQADAMSIHCFNIHDLADMILVGMYSNEV